jgi:hypothetical protein
MGGAVKDSSNPFFKSSYADLTSVIKAIKVPFSDNGLTYTQFPISNEQGVGVVTRLMHISGQWLEEECVLPIVKRDPQAAGSAITYARRYALQSIAGIPTADDDAESAMLRTEPEKVISAEQCESLADLIGEAGADEAKFCKAFKIKNRSDLPASRFSRAVTMLTTKIENNKATAA